MTKFFTAPKVISNMVI